ncbi:restriction endonuclease subunit S [Hahella aquimaris]|uniref:restriction endonuclease subunit S n=1 Tax=Hahella sp. HNIBRBA332 TaxID=3015983 RepID=UPI00273C3704|nr:restriction endonuclease subunit S [Hahella sp. HNIBRBA332]WLQ14239.1 restriction endonuclease subunit S [Hahella sp. HNIBRBA332]
MAFTKDIEELIKEDSSGLLSKHESWERVLISDIALVINGYAFKSAYFNSKGEGLPLIRIRDVISGDTETYYDGPFDEEYLISSGDFLIGMDGDFNCAFWRSGNALLNQRVCKIDLKTGNYNFKLLSYLMPHYLNAINANTSSMTVKHLSSKTVNDILLPLPPKNEQTRIVEKLEELLSDLDNGVAELKAAQIKLTQYRQSLLKSAVEGSLTAEWRKQNKVSETGEQLLQRILKERRERWESEKLAEFKAKGKTPPKDWQSKYPEPVAPDISELPELPEGWVWASVAQVCELQGGIQKQPKRTPKENCYPFLRVANVYRNELKLEEIHEVELFDGELERLRLLEGDLLIVEGNGSKSEIGRCALWDGSIRNAVHQNHLIRARPVLLSNPYLLHWLNSPIGIEIMGSLAVTTSGLYTLSVSKIARIPIPLPPTKEQNYIVDLVNSGLEVSSAEDTDIVASLKRSEAQRKNILKDAFSGKLVPQDLEDEPASVLLERIKAERMEAAKQKKPKQPKKKANKQTMNMETLEEVLKSKADWIEAQEAFRECGVTDGTETDRIEELYNELRKLDKAERLDVERHGDYDMIRLISE